MNNNEINNNSKILFVYEAKNCNPNGDFDNGNAPRMDKDTMTNIVTDVRLKRYIRDYLKRYHGKDIFIIKDAKDAKDRGKQLKIGNLDFKDLIDVRLFGAVFAQEKNNDHVTGPVQFNWGTSYNPVYFEDTSTITSSFSSGEGIGSDIRVKYSLIGFDGNINAFSTKESTMKQEDLKLLEEAIIKAIPLCTTRSKMGQQPMFYIRVDTANNMNLRALKDLTSINYKVEKYMVRNIKDYSFDISNLIMYLEKNKDIIKNINIWRDDFFNIEEKQYQKLLNIFNNKINEIK